VYKE
jgi:hypothetical protein